jgi:hypothetical protein
LANGDTVGHPHGFTIRGEERNHLAISWTMELPVIGLADQEQRARGAGRLPTCPGTAALAEPKLDAKCSHERLVEGHSPFEIRHANEDMREHDLQRS